LKQYPRLIINTDKIRKNASVITELARNHDIDVYGVTKVSCGDEKVASAMLEGGVKGIGDSHTQNLKNLRKNGINAELMLLRTPMISEISDVIRYADVSLNSEIDIIRKLSEESLRQGKTHRIILMVEMGDLREGMTEEELFSSMEEILSLKGIEVVGIGMNLACFGGIVPTEKKVREFSDMVDKIEKKFNVKFGLVSGGNSANIPLLQNGKDCGRINHLRIGEGIVLGKETVEGKRIPGTDSDAFVIEAEIIELKKKRSVPAGIISRNAFGETPVFKDIGEIRRGILAIGRQDTVPGGLTPCDPYVEIIGSSSDHLIVNIKSDGYSTGDIMSFIPNYGALLAAFTSKYVIKEYV